MEKSCHPRSRRCFCYGMGEGDSEKRSPGEGESLDRLQAPVNPPATLSCVAIRLDRGLWSVLVNRLDVHLQKSPRTFSLMVRPVSTSVKIATSSKKARTVTDLPKKEMPFNFFDKRSNNGSRSKSRGGWREGNPAVRKTSTAHIRLSRSRLEWTLWHHHKEL